MSIATRSPQEQLIPPAAMYVFERVAALPQGFWIADMKTCTKCKVKKELTEFPKRKNSVDGTSSWCKGCKNEDNAKRYQLNRKELRIKSAEYYRANKKRISLRQSANRKKINAYRKKWRAANLKKINKKNAKYQRTRIKSDPAYALTRRIRNRAYFVLRGSEAPGFFRHMPYTKDEFVAHLLSTLPEGYVESDACDGKKLHIDHIRPMSSFNLTGEIDDEFLTCWSLDNLQLIPAEENLKKGNSLDWQPPSSDGEQLSWRWMA